jgi:hypothetical protein
MNSLNINPRIVKIIRWIARVWSILIFVIALLIVVVPDPNIVQPVPLTDWIELGFYWVSILGLLLAWRWEGLGGAIAIAGVVGHGVAFRIIRGYWFHILVPAALLEFVLALPGILFQVCWALSRGRSASRSSGGKREAAGPMATTK